MAEVSQYTESNTEFKRNGNSIYNSDFLNYLIDNRFFKYAFEKGLQVQDEFLDTFPKWVQSSKLNSIRGLSTFNYRFPSVGVTQSLDEFHYRDGSRKRHCETFEEYQDYSKKRW